jgi:hypothetical protein
MVKPENPLKNKEYLQTTDKAYKTKVTHINVLLPEY